MDETTRPSIRGIIPACVTAFGADGGIDLDVQTRLLEWHIAAGVHGLFVCGTAGEFWALSPVEKESLWRHAVEVADGRVPVFAGTCDNTTVGAVDLARRAAAAGVDGITVLTPFAVTLSQEELFGHYCAIAAAVDVTVVLYNNPNLTGVALAPETVARLAAACPNIRAIKDSSGDVASVRAFVEATPDDFWVLNGYDGALLAALEVGAAGGVCGSANVMPAVCVQIYESSARGEAEGACAAQARLSLFRDAWRLGTPPSVIKAGAELAGIPVGPPRPPVEPLGEHARSELARTMREAGADVKD